MSFKAAFEFAVKHPYPLLPAVGLIAVWKPVEDYCFDKKMYLETMSKLCNHQRIRFSDSEKRVEYVDEEEDLNSERVCLREFASILWKLNRCNPITDPFGLLRDIFRLPKLFSPLSIELTVDISRRLDYFLEAEVSKAGGKTSRVKPQANVSVREFYELFFNRGGKSINDVYVTEKKAQDMVCLSILRHRMLCKTVLMGYLTECSPLCWFIAYIACDNIAVDTYFKLKAFLSSK